MTVKCRTSVKDLFLYLIYFLSVELDSLPCSFISNRIGGVMVSVFASSAVDRGFEPRSGQSNSIKQKEQRLVGSRSESE
jgi:hypothetical protein